MVENYNGTASLIQNSETAMKLQLDPPKRRDNLCRSQPLPPVVYTVYFAPVSHLEEESCSNNLRLCEAKVRKILCFVVIL